MKKILTVFGIILAVLLVLGFLKDQLIKTAVTTVFSRMTGAPLKIDHLSLGIFSQSIKIEGLRLYNPPGFPSEVMLDAPLIFAQMEVPALLKNQIHLFSLDIKLKEMVIIENKEGKLNVDSLKVVESQKKEGTPGPEKPSKARPSFLIDVARFDLGRVVHKRYKSGEQYTTEAFDLNVKNKVYKNITSPEQLVLLILVEHLKRTAIKNAAIYGAANLVGVAFLPAGVAAAFLGEANASADFNVSFDKAYQTSLQFLSKSGKILTEDRQQGLIKAKYEGYDIVVRVVTNPDQSTKIDVQAKKMLLPKAQIAGGILHEISRQLP